MQSSLIPPVLSHDDLDRAAAEARANVVPFDRIKRRFMRVIVAILILEVAIFVWALT